MTKKLKIIKDTGAEDPSLSLLFAQEHTAELEKAVLLQAHFKTAGPTAEWNTYNVRFTTSDKVQLWFSGLNINYRGNGPQTLLKILKLSGWNINKDLVYINEHLKVARKLPDSEKESAD